VLERAAGKAACSTRWSCCILTFALLSSELTVPRLSIPQHFAILRISKPARLGLFATVTSKKKGRMPSSFFQNPPQVLRRPRAHVGRILCIPARP
jgi:hypothetical protein